MKFILTRELGRLSKWLRILGLDAEYFTEHAHSSLIIKALQEDRVILTRNAHLGAHSGVKMLLVKSDYCNEQLKQVIKDLVLKPEKHLMFTRCILCNELLSQIEKEKVKDNVPAYVFKTQDNFITCPKCRRIYWQGSHWGNVEEALKEIL